MLRVYHDGANPDEVTVALGLSPEQSVRPGDIVHGVESETSSWSWSTQQAVLSDYVDEHLIAIAAHLEPRAAALALLRRNGWNLDLMVPWTSYGYDGPSITSETMRRLAALGLDVWFPIHHERDLSDR